MGNKRRIKKRGGKSNQRPVRSTGSDVPEPIELKMSELEEIIARSHTEPLSEQDCDQLRSVLQTLCFLTQELEKKRVSVKRLKQMLFGASTEKLSKILDEALGQDEKDKDKNKEGKEQDSPSDAPEKDKPKPKGHGRNGADAYAGAEKVTISHATLKPGDRCPDCGKGTVYETSEPGRLVRVTGQAPLNATVYELQKLRCNLCSKIFTAAAPEKVGNDKYDAESVSMIALLKYGSGMPFNRLGRLQENMGIPLPAPTQWDILSNRVPVFIPILERLILIAAQGKIVHNDDTGMKVLELFAQNKPEKTDFPAGSDEQTSSKRKGVFTSGIVSVDDGYRIAWYFTGRQHAGENLADVLQHRAAELAPPIQMCDALSRNTSGDFKTILANCLSHGRRKFKDVVENFPSQCRYVLERIGEVYKNDDVARQRKLSDQDRLLFHQSHSKELMDELELWMKKQLDDKLVEPNSGLGEAIAYMLKHGKELTLFLRKPGAPLDNNVCERALKKAILHRKNAYFYKTQNGARVGDLFMSLIHTCELNNANPFDYLTQLQKHAQAAVLCPADWMPWNYQQTLALSQSSGNG